LDSSNLSGTISIILALVSILLVIVLLPMSFKPLTHVERISQLILMSLNRLPENFCRNETKACILSTSLGEDVAALFRTRQALAGRRTDAERDAYAEGMRRVSACSQYMLVPGAGVWRADCMLIAC
jgi:hypothetical protein